jgi:hypothetical protein
LAIAVASCVLAMIIVWAVRCREDLGAEFRVLHLRSSVPPLPPPP